MKKTERLSRFQKGTKEVVKELRKVASEAKKRENVRAAILLTFEQGNVVGQYVLGELRLFESIGALEILKTDLLNQADQIKKGELELV